MDTPAHTHLTTRSKQDWRERLGLVRSTPAVLARSLLGLRRLAHRSVSAVLGRIVAKIPEHSPGDAFSGALDPGTPLLH